jgi:hypothetical protein
VPLHAWVGDSNEREQAVEPYILPESTISAPMSLFHRISLTIGLCVVAFGLGLLSSSFFYFLVSLLRKLVRPSVLTTKRLMRMLLRKIDGIEDFDVCRIKLSYLNNQQHLQIVISDGNKQTYKQLHNIRQTKSNTARSYSSFFFFHFNMHKHNHNDYA